MPKTKKSVAKLGVSRSQLYFRICVCICVCFICVLFGFERHFQLVNDAIHSWHHSTNASENFESDTVLYHNNKSALRNQVSDTVWHKTSLYQIFDRFHNRTLETCLNKCDNKTFGLGCTARNADDYQRLISKSKLRFVPLLSQHEYVFSYEKEYLNDPPLTDARKLPDRNLSRVVLPRAVNNVVTCQINDIITGHVQLVNGYGDERKVGGDELRVWIVNKKDKRLRAAGHVTDLRNGSYQISFRCLWPGELEVNVAVPYPREYLRLVILQSYLGVTRYNAARFKKDTVEEVTVCWSTPNIPGRPCLCNLTADNHNHPFYCGRPLDPRLSCSDWIATTVLHMPAPPSERFSTVEMLLIKNAFGPVKKHLIRHTVKVTVSTKGKLPNLLPCSHMSPNVTWDWSQWPTAYWTNKNTWRSLICEAPELTPKWAIPCLSNTRVWIFGDSNSWRLFLALMKRVKIPHDGTSWSFQQYGRNKNANITISLSPLEYPLYFGKFLWRDRITADGVAQQLDHIPSTGRHIVIIHYYLHVTSSHLSVLEARLKILEASIKRLLVRNPEVVIGIRGPHTVSKMWDVNQAVGGDCLGTFFLKMLLEVFKDLQHKIVFLDGWEMTIASENLDRHPPPAIADQLIRTLLSFICD